MNKKVVSFLIFCIGTVFVGLIILSYEHLSSTLPFTPPLYAIETSIAEINSNPYAWMNKTVVVEGNLSGPWAHVQWVPPYNYRLTGHNKTVFIGVLWNDNNLQYYSGKAILLGVVRKGYWIQLGEKGEICYYIEAQKIHKLS